MKHISKFEIIWAIYYVILSLFWMIFEKVMGWHDENIDLHQTMSPLFGIIAILVYVFYMKAKKNQLGEKNNYINLLIGGISVSLIIAFMAPLSQYIVHEIITPDFFSNVKLYAIENGVLSVEAAENEFNYSSYVLKSIIGAISMGVLTSSIVAIFFRKPNKELE